MAVDEKELRADEITFYSAARENTGASILDSGSAYGRHHEAAPIPESIPVITLLGNKYGEYMDVSADLAINTAAFLDAWMDIDRELQRKFEAWMAGAKGGTRRFDRIGWFEAGETFMEDMGYLQRARGNVYNGENDLTQMYVYEVYELGGASRGDWFYSDDNIVSVFYIHTGCDVRGGYGRPIFCRSKGDYAIPMDVVIGVVGIEGRDADGDDLGYSKATSLTEKYSIGYTGAPLYHFDDAVERVFWFTYNEKENTVVVKMETGELLKVMFYADGPDGDWL